LLCAEADHSIVANRDAVGAWEQFQVELHDDGCVALKTTHGFYVCVEPSGVIVANRSAVGPWEKLVVNPHIF